MSTQEPEIIEDIIKTLKAFSVDLVGFPNSDDAAVHAWLERCVRVEHKRGMCSWGELVDFARKNKSDIRLENYADEDACVRFRVWGDDWVLYFDNNKSDSFYSDWKMVSICPDNQEPVKPESMDDIVKLWNHRFTTD